MSKFSFRMFGLSQMTFLSNFVAFEITQTTKEKRADTSLPSQMESPPMEQAGSFSVDKIFVFLPRKLAEESWERRLLNVQNPHDRISSHVPSCRTFGVPRCASRIQTFHAGRLSEEGRPVVLGVTETQTTNTRASSASRQPPG